jgi:DNA-binding NarL/FixJ family response regulator
MIDGADTTMTVRVMIVDDHKIVLEGLKEFIRREPNVTLVGEAGGVREAVRKASEVRPDVVLMDVRLPDGDGIEATRLIRSLLPETQVLLLTVHEDHETALLALRVGAAGYVLKDIAPEILMRALQSVPLNGTMVQTIVPRKLLDQMAGARPGARKPPLTPHETAVPRTGRPPLTPRETTVLREVAAGLTDKEIASKLLLGGTTVKSHLRSAYKKLGIHNRAQAATYAVKAGLDDHATLPMSETRLGPARRGIPASLPLLGEPIGSQRHS